MCDECDKYVIHRGEGWNVSRLHGKVLVAGGTGVASLGKQQDLPHWCTETVLANSKIDPPLAKAEPINDTSDISLITYLRKGKNYCATAAGREE